MSFIKKSDNAIKFAVDIKTTYRLKNYDGFCNGFTLGSHGEYFRNRRSTKNIQFPYGGYTAHLCLGVLYTRSISTDIGRTQVLPLDKLGTVSSVIKELLFFAEEKWKISSDKRSSGNTANIGSIDYITDILNGNGVFVKIGGSVFDEYWTERGILDVIDLKNGGSKKLTKLIEFLKYKGWDESLINKQKSKR